VTARALLAAACLAAAACRADAPPDAAETPIETPVDAPTPAPAANTFDPGAVQPGDSVLGLVVVSKSVERAAAIDSVWVGNVVFEGDLVVRGVYQAHFDWPENVAPCFHVTDPASAARIPRFAPDSWTSPDAKTWFCFSNPEVALELLGPAEQPRELVIALSRYVIWRQFTDANDEAELSELLEVGPESTRTLIEP
jgi:hypothetical protein